MNIRKKRLRGGKMNYNKIEERLKEKVKELKGEERRLDVFKHLTVEQAEELLESVGIHIEYCIEALHYADNGIHHYEFFTGKINKKDEREILEIEFNYNADIFGHIGNETVINLCD